jgi:putative DNA primase/helicase
VIDTPSTWEEAPLAPSPTSKLDALAARYAAELERVFKAQTVNAVGKLFAEVYADELRFLNDRGVWLRWDGRRWEYAHAQRVEYMAKQIAELMFRYACDLPSEDEKKGEPRKSAVAFALRHHYVGAYRLIADEGKTVPSLWAQAGDFDRAHHLLTADNGTIDLRTGTLLRHDPAHKLTKLTPIAYHADAPCPRWLQFLDEIFLARPDLIAYVHRAVGYTLTGETREQKFFLMHDERGNNGKAGSLSRSKPSSANTRYPSSSTCSRCRASTAASAIRRRWR